MNKPIIGIVSNTFLYGKNAKQKSSMFINSSRLTL